MSDQKKSSNEDKPQQQPPKKPAVPEERNLRTGWTTVADSFDGFKKKGK